MRKVRIATRGGGKSGAARVAYLYVQAGETIYLLLAVPKNVQANLTADQKKALRKLVGKAQEEGMTMAKKNRIEVTSENFGDLLIQGLEEAVAVEEGRAKPARVSRRKITVRKADVAPAPSYNRANIVKVRKSLGVSQPVFASMLNVS